MSRKPEIMAPAGDFISLSAALQAGADAVYFGVEGANMRAGAKNFKLSEIRKICALCHAKNARAYLALNTIYFDSERARLERIISAAKRAEVDALIAWDFSVIEIAKKHGVPVFLSTQASVANAEAVASYYKNFGIARCVLARECTLENLKSIRGGLKKILGADAKKVSMEVFAHGAMCVSVSGRCFMSLFSCNKSANRGECAQPCRRSYDIYDTEESSAKFNLRGQYVMSPKDLCTLPFIEELIKAGVDSLKIEGRGRNAEYVFETVSAYRKAVDFYFENRRKIGFDASFAALKKRLMERLESVFNRGFSDGFFMGRPLGNWTSTGNMAKEKKKILGHVLKYFPKAMIAEISIDNSRISVGEDIQIEGEKSGYLRFKLEGMHADSFPISEAAKGDIITLKVPRPVRKMDRVFRF